MIEKKQSDFKQWVCFLWFENWTDLQCRLRGGWCIGWDRWAFGQRPLMMKWFLVFNTIIRHTTPSPRTPGQLTSVIRQQKVAFELNSVAPFHGSPSLVHLTRDWMMSEIWISFSVGQNEICCFQWNKAFKSVKPELLNLVKLSSVFLQFVLLLCDSAPGFWKPWIRKYFWMAPLKSHI